MNYGSRVYKGVFGTWLYNSMKENDISQAFLSELMGMHRSIVSHHLRMDCAPNSYSIYKYSKVFNIPADDILKMLAEDFGWDKR